MKNVPYGQYSVLYTFYRTQILYDHFLADDEEGDDDADGRSVLW